MTLLLALLGGALAVAVAAAVTWRWWRARGAARIAAPEQAMDAAAAALAGFTPLAAAVGMDGAAALVSGAGDRLAALRAGTGQVRAHEIAWAAVRATPEGIVVETDAPRFGHVALAGLNALDVRRLAPAARPVAA